MARLDDATRTGRVQGRNFKLRNSIEVYSQGVIYWRRPDTTGHLEEPVKRTALFVAAAAVTVSITACSRPEPVSEAPVETVSNHAAIEITWEKDLPSALERARREGKPVLINFYADWCVWCKRLESTTLRDAKVATVLQNRVVPLSLNVESNGRELSNEYRVDGLPTIVVLSADGSEIGRIPGYMPPDSFVERVEDFLQQS